MRILIDLLDVRAGAGDDADLARIQALVRSAAAMDTWLAVPDDPATYRMLEHAFAGLLPRARMRPFALTGDARLRTLLRRHALASLAPDAVLVPASLLAELNAAATARATAGAAAADPVTGASAADAVTGATAGAATDAAAGSAADAVADAAAGPAAWAAGSAALPAVAFDPAADAATLLTRLAATAAERMAPPGTARPRLAYVSPLPPERSGIADYSAVLAPELARYYEVELVVAQDGFSPDRVAQDRGAQAHRDDRLAGLPRRSVDWFLAHAHRYDRVLYHFGNSPVHKHMFDLIRRVPGVVLMHDFYFGNVLDHLDHQGSLAGGFTRALYESHGLSGLLGLRREGRAAAAWAYPVNKGILDHAAGVIVHAEYPKTLARQWYGPDAADGWHTIPLLRAGPAGARSEEARADAPEGTRDSTRRDASGNTRSDASGNASSDARKEARERLGIALEDFIVCSFGMLGPTKLNQELVAAFLASPLAHAPRCALVFVGENDPGQYGAELLQTIRAAGVSGASGASATSGVSATSAIHTGAGARIRITGFADAGAYADWLAACDAAVQLRRASRGETSAALLDCLLYGVPTVVNAHGAAASLAGDLVLKLPDMVDSGALAAAVADALARLREDAALRARLSQRAAAHMQAEHAPAHAGRLCQAAIEHIARRGEPAAYRALVAQAAPLCAEDALPALAGAIAFNRAVAAPRQLLVDVSALALEDLRTGIQRVVRQLLLALIAAPPPGYRVEPVCTPGANRGYCYARDFGIRLVGGDSTAPGHAFGLAPEDAPVDLRPGDIFFGLDLYLSGTVQNEQALLAMRARGVELYFCVYDLLPMLRPDVFPFGTEGHFDTFLRTVHRVADGVLCISRAVADELAGWIAHEGLAPQRGGRPLQLGWFHLGADIDIDINRGAPGPGLPTDAGAVLRALDALGTRPSFLMVGTVEPRKGHAQALAAFELLWAQGLDLNLVVVGKEGWMVEDLARRLRGHPERDARLFWLPGIPDAMLLDLYAGATALLAPSEGEGFGLPLIEAARHGLPIVARGLPVFREVAGEHAHYFDGCAPPGLADALRDWLALWRAGKAPASAGMPWLCWDASARQVLRAIVGGNWYRTL